MEAALRNIHDGDGLRVKGIVYNIPVETLQRRATGTVTIVCRPAWTKTAKEQALYDYCIAMADMGFGLSRDDVIRKAFQ